MKYVMIAVVVGLMSVSASQAVAKPLKVFILAGQSNMQGNVDVSTFDSMADDPKTAPILKEMRNADGTPRVCEKVWISALCRAYQDTNEYTGRLTTGFAASTHQIGPEFTFGIYNEWYFDDLDQPGVSNGGYHYLGAAKIMAPIGKAFAEALVSFQQPQRREKP